MPEILIEKFDAAGALVESEAVLVGSSVAGITYIGTSLYVLVKTTGG